MSTTKRLKCRILKLEPDPKHPNRTIVSVRFDDAAGFWVQGFSLLPGDRVMNVDEFLEGIIAKGINRPLDHFAELRAAIGRDLDITIPGITPSPPSQPPQA